MTHDDGYLLDNRQPEAGTRFDVLSVIFDPPTFRRMEDLGVGAGLTGVEADAFFAITSPNVRPAGDRDRQPHPRWAHLRWARDR